MKLEPRRGESAEGVSVSYWYSDLSSEKPKSIALGVEPHWYDGIVNAIPRYKMSGLKVNLFWIIDGPARLIGELIIPLYAIAAFAAVIFCGNWIAKRIERKTGKPFSVVCGIVVGVYIALVLYRAQHWAAFAFLSSTKD